ncbi:C-Jun-amino-terminal kinase-interacting protein 1-like [Centroberyx gerrardi]
MDTYRPKRPTTLALFPQLPQPGTQDTINNNSLGKKDSWKESHSSSPHITGDLTPPDTQPKAEDKVRNNSRRPAPKPPTTNGADSRTKSHTQAASTAGDAHSRSRERQPTGAAHTHSAGGPRNQRRGGGGGGGRGRGSGGGGRGAAAMRERNLGEIRGRDGGMGVKEDRRGGRLCEESKGKEKERNGHQKAVREANGLKARGGEGRGKAGPRGGSRGGGVKASNLLPTQEIYLTAMVVPRTPVVPRNQDRTQDPGQNHDRTQDCPPVLSRSSSEGGSNRMSLSSDTEGPPPGPLHPTLPDRTNPVISEEEGEGDPTPSVNSGPTRCLGVNEKREKDCTKSGGREVGSKAEVDASNSVPAKGGSVAGRTGPNREATAGLNYDSVKYTLVVDEHAQLELVSLKDCFHSYSERNDDSDAETVYQSANEEEDPEYEEERKRKEEERQERRKEEEKRRKEQDEVKRRREEVVNISKHSKVTSTTTSEEEESNGGRAGAPRTRKFLNLFVNGSSNYNSTGAGSFGMFSCVLDGVERQQSHRAVYRFVPRHADELYLETDDPVLMLAQSEDLWCQGYNMRTGSTGIFPAYYAVRVDKDTSKVQKDGWIEQFLVRFLGSVQVPFHKGNDVLCAAMQKVACNRRLAMQPPSACVLEVSVKGLKISVQDQCHSAVRGDQCFHFFQLKNISFCGCHPKHSKYFGFITKHPDQQRFACHVMMSETTSLPLAESVGRAFQQYYKEHVGYSCPTEDIFIE